MNNPFFSEIFITILLIINCGRIFFLKYGKSDCLTTLSPICLILSIANIIAWNIDLFSAVILILSFFATIINFRALLRFFSGLLVDHYSIAFKISDLLVLFASIAGTFILLIFTPSVTNLYNYDVKETTVRLTGNFTQGFKEAGIFDSLSGTVKIYESEHPENSRNQIIMMLTDKRSDFRFYKPYIALLAKAGYKIYMADYYASDIRWFNSPFDSHFLRQWKMDEDYFENKIRFESEKEFYTYNSMFEYKALLNFIEKKEGIIPVDEESQDSAENTGDKTADQAESENENIEKAEINGPKPVFIITDWMAEDAAVDFMKENPGKAAGLLKLSELECYKTVGFGNVQLESPYLASRLGFERNTSRAIPQEMADKTIEAIQVVAPYFPPEPESDFESEDADSESNNETEKTDAADSESTEN